MITYLDCFSGISGDMLLGALIDAGMPIKELERGLSCLPLKGYSLNVKKVKRAGFRATKVDVILKSARGQGLGSQSSEGKRWEDIEKIIEASTFPNDIKQKGLEIFKRLFTAEAKVHGERLEDTHLHELGSLDCIIDIFGALIGLDFFKIEGFYSSPINLGGGTVRTEHGTLPVPAPATAELLKNVPVYSSHVNFELTTPTGAVIVSSLAFGFGPMPEMEISRIGIGAGGQDFRGHPNVLRLFIGERLGSHASQGKAGEHKIQNTEETMTIIETNIDDMNPQVYEYIIERLFKAGALDVFLTQVIMKKARPGILLTVLCSDSKKEDLIKIILRETTSIGVRFYEAGRKTLERKLKRINTEFGDVNVKIARLGEDLLKITPEYEDCKKIAKRLDMPLIEVMKRVYKIVSVGDSFQG